MDPKVWIGCLACYNDGALVGEWFDALGAGEIDLAQVHAGSPRRLHTSCEELWVMDHEGFGGALKGECAPGDADRLAEVLADVEDFECDPFAAYLSYQGSAEVDESTVSDFRECYEGVFDSPADWAGEYVESTGMLHGLPDEVTSYFDMEAFGRDAFIGGDLYSVDAPGLSIYVFRSL
ncbi:antirestriction protein ArdA [Rhodococcus antarcticus]|uniref:Antirestriction protein ArdA n=1 Tax=Rhodococcus antarcticus TaxID=2987751 RepID=A0ABY6NXI8_9NOCA|nr:antirestriction protein ArdA [Rhodococcus antarcticus]UZJ23698.1 antirestriction protein ArdA [Rhodococcus antarcticus]